jgi:hypothetical protein
MGLSKLLANGVAVMQLLYSPRISVRGAAKLVFTRDEAWKVSWKLA